MKKLKDFMFNLKEKVSSVITKVSVGVLSYAGVTLCSNKVFAATNISGAISNAKKSVVDPVKTVVDGFIIPALLIGLGIALVVAVSKAVVSYRKGDGADLFPIIMIICGILAIGAFSQWGWTLIGIK